MFPIQIHFVLFYSVYITFFFNASIYLKAMNKTDVVAVC